VKSKVDTSKAEKEVKQKKLKVSFSESLIQGPSPYGFRTETTSARGGDSFSAEKYESSKEVENGHALDDYCLSNNEKRVMIKHHQRRIKGLMDSRRIQSFALKVSQTQIMQQTMRKHRLQGLCSKLAMQKPSLSLPH